MGQILWGIAIFCMIILGFMHQTAIWSLTASKPEYFVNIFDFIGVILLMLQNPIVWILIVVMLLCIFGASKF